MGQHECACCSSGPCRRVPCQRLHTAHLSPAGPIPRPFKEIRPSLHAVGMNRTTVSGFPSASPPLPATCAACGSPPLMACAPPEHLVPLGLVQASPQRAGVGESPIHWGLQARRYSRAEKARGLWGARLRGHAVYPQSGLTHRPSNMMHVLAHISQELCQAAERLCHSGGRGRPAVAADYSYQQHDCCVGVLHEWLQGGRCIDSLELRHRKQQGNCQPTRHSGVS